MLLCAVNNLAADLSSLLAPRSIALVGASKANAYATRLLDNLKNGGFTGRRYLVNRRYPEIDGERCYPSVEALPETPELAAIVVPQRVVIPILEECARKGVKAAIIISAGFSEAGDAGRADQEKICEIADAHGMLVCGPNCLGIANTATPAMIHSYSAAPIKRGNIALVSQSGALAFASILSPATDRGLGFSYVVSSGNEAGLDSTDYIRHFVGDPETRVIICFLEGLKRDHGRRFLTVAEEAADAGKPIVVCKVGRSALGARQVVSHTGSMTGSDAVYDAAFQQTGAIRVPDPDDLFEVASIFSRCAEPKGEGLAILSTSGGLGVLLADKCGMHGLELPPLSPEISSALSHGEFFLVVGDLGNPLDIRGQGSEHLPEILRLFVADPRYHILTVALGLPAVGDRSTRIARDLIKVASEADKPLIVLWTGTKLGPGGRVTDDDGFRLLEASGIPIFGSPDKYFRALQAFISFHRFRRHRAARSARAGASLPRIDVAAARAFVASKQGALDEADSRRLLSFYGIPLPREALVADVDPAVAAVDAVTRAATEIGYPIVLKVISPEVPHKTEAGGVRAGIRDEATLRSAYVEMIQAVEQYRPGARIRGVLVQEMIEGAREMIVGLSHDPQFGPVVTSGVGGVFVELLHDVSRRVPPLAADDARAMISALQAAPMLGRFRGQPPADVEAVVDVIQRVGQMGLDLEDRIAEVDINPLMVREDGRGACAVDALVVLKP